MSSEIGNIMSENRLSKTFFSNENISILQNSIRFTIFQKTGKIIGNQSKRELQIIMRSIFLQYSKNNEHNIKEQVNQLNKKVTDYSVPIIYSNLNQHLRYVKKIDEIPMPMTHPKNVSNTGSKTLIFNKF